MHCSCLSMRNESRLRSPMLPAASLLEMTEAVPEASGPFNCGSSTTARLHNTSHSSERSLGQHAALLTQMPPVQAAAFTVQARCRRQASPRRTYALTRGRHTGAAAIPRTCTKDPTWEPYRKRSKPTMPSTSPGPPLTSPSRSIVIITGSRMVRGPSDQEAALIKRAGTCRA